MKKGDVVKFQMSWEADHTRNFFTGVLVELSDFFQDAKSAMWDIMTEDRGLYRQFAKELKPTGQNVFDLMKGN